MNFKKFKKLYIKVPKKEIMENKKPLEFQTATALIDIDNIAAVCYHVESFPSDSSEEKEVDMYCKTNHITLVNITTKKGLLLSNIIEPFKGYFDAIFDLSV